MKFVNDPFTMEIQNSHSILSLRSCVSHRGAVYTGSPLMRKLFLFRPGLRGN